MLKEQTYYVKGMHCASCEILIEKKLLDIEGIKSVDASTGKGQVTFEYEGDKPDINKINSIFKGDNYNFSEKVQNDNKEKEETKKPANATLVAFNIAIFIIIAFLLLDKAGVSGFLSVSSKSSLIGFFLFGLLAGVSSCAALVGGIVLSMSKQWQEIYADKQTNFQKLQPHILFNSGRILSYAVLGGVLGLIGSRLQISFRFTAFLVVVISFLMIALGLQMLGVKAFRRFQFSVPKFITRYIANENNFKGKYMPFIMGALTFFLPCGFTITAQGLALLSGNAFQGALIMGAFALGTAPMLLFIGFSSVKFLSKPHLAERFSKAAGFLVLFFALFNIGNQMTVLGFTGINFQSTQSVSQSNLPPIVDGKQVIKMIATGSSDSPNYFQVKAGVPVRWEITAGSSLGCNSGIISTSLFDGSINLTPGQVSIKEFTPQNPGRYRFSCWMGMVSGIIEVVDSNSPTSNAIIQTASAATVDQVVPSGSKGCGCGSGGGNSCSARRVN